MRRPSRFLLMKLRPVTFRGCQRPVTTATQSLEDAKHSPGEKGLLDIPGPTGLVTLPYIGMRFMFKPFSQYDMRLLSHKMEALKNEFGPIVRVRAGKNWHLYAFDPNDIEQVFRAEGKYPARKALPLFTIYDKRNNASPSLSNLNGEEWHKLRIPTQTIMMRPKAVTKYAPKLSQIADDFVAVFEKKDRIDNLPYKLMEYSAEGVGMLCFNTRLGCITHNNTVTPLMKNVEVYLDCIGNHFFRAIPSYLFFRTKFYQKFEDAANFLYGKADDQIRMALAELTQRSEDSEQEGNLLFDLLSTPGLTPEKVRRTITDVFIAGIDSTANSMTFLLFHLAKNQDKQDRLFEELKEHVPQKGVIEESTMNKMPYLKACLKESFRLVFPIAGGTLRLLDREITLQGYRIPAQTPIQLCSGIICRDESYFPEQDRYIPERWLRTGDTRTDVNPFAHLPFGFGPRKCIGQRFAEQEIYICIAKLLRNYRVVLPPGVENMPFQYSIFATPKEPASFMLEKREV